MTAFPIQTKLYTVDDLINMSVEGKRYELIEGELVEHMPPGDEHGTIASLIAKFIWDFVLLNGIDGRAGVESSHVLALNPDTVRAPDAYYDSIAHTGPLTESVIRAAPELAVEVVSPSEAADDVEGKIRDYLRAGTRIVWVVYPKTQTVHVRTTTMATIIEAAGVLDGGDVLPGFSLSLSDLFTIVDRLKKRP